MGTYRNAFGPHAAEATYVEHRYPEHLVDLDEVQMNYVTAGDPALPALLLIPGQTESWWGFEDAIALLTDHFQVFAIDLRGQGRSTRTPGRYTLDNFGNDVVRFIDLVIGRPTLVSGLSSGGVVTAWLSAYARPGQVIAAHYEDPPLFAAQVAPAVGPGIMDSIGPMFRLWATHLGPQWSIGDWDGMVAAAPEQLPGWMSAVFQLPAEPGQNLKEYDPEWGLAFSTGSVFASCDHARMLSSVRVPVLFTHHFRMIDPATGALMGASSDQQAEHVCNVLREAGVAVDYRSFPTMGHSMHGQDPPLYVDTLLDWVRSVTTASSI